MKMSDINDFMLLIRCSNNEPSVSSSG